MENFFPVIHFQQLSFNNFFQNALLKKQNIFWYLCFILIKNDPMLVNFAGDESIGVRLVLLDACACGESEAVCVASHPKPECLLARTPGGNLTYS